MLQLGGRAGSGRSTNSRRYPDGKAAATGVPQRIFSLGIYVSPPFPDRPGGEIELNPVWR